MKVVIDLDLLLAEGKITQSEYDRFNQLSTRGTAALAFNILVGFGVVAVSAAALALLPTPATAIGLGLVVCAIGMALVHARTRQWSVLADICVVVGTLLLGGGMVGAGDGSVGSFLMVAVAFGAAGIFVRSRLLIVLAVLALSSCLGARTGYFHATYLLGIMEPALTVAFFSVLSILAFQASRRLAPGYRPIAMAAAGTGVFLVNFGFWIGSLWGDRRANGEILVADSVFAIVWAIALIAAAAWSWQRSRRWVLNVVAIFGAIHFYTQWFERLGASPSTVLVAGLLALAFAVGLRAANQKLPEQA